MNEYIDEWVDAREDLPQLALGFNYLSMNVRCMTDTGEICEGFYHYQDNEWWGKDMSNGVRKINVIKWQSL